MTISPETLDVMVLSYVSLTGNIKEALDKGIDDDSFHSEETSSAWKYLLDKFKNGQRPSKTDIFAVSNVELLDEVQDGQTFIDYLAEVTVARRARKVLTPLAAMLDRNPVSTVEKMIGELQDIIKSPSVANFHYFDGEAAGRFALVKDRRRKKDEGLNIGIRTGLPILDDAGDNWMPGDVIAIQGPLNVGKSTLLLWFCAHAYYYDGQKILFLSPESTIADVEARLDPMISRFMGIELSNRKIRNGTIDLDLYREYITRLEKFGRSDWITRDSGDAGVFTVDDIVQQCREHRPNILAIDGVHLIRGEGKTWEVMKRAAETLKGLAHHMKMVILGGTQVTRDAVIATDDTAELGQSAYGMGFLETANKVISLGDVRGDAKRRIFKMPKNRDGNKLTARNYLLFDVDSGNIGPADVNVNSSTGIVDF